MGRFAVKPIHTLDARGNIMLEVIRDHFGIAAPRMQIEIQRMRHDLEESLAQKGIAYDKLKSALVPDRKRREIALVFDTLEIEESWYGLAVFERLIPLLDKRSNHSILVGDYLDRTGQADQQFQAFKTAVKLSRSIDYKHPTQFYIVYINNLTDGMIRAFDEGLASYEGYVGYADATYASQFKFYLSTMLVNLGIKYGKVIIQGHEADRPDSDDVNMCGYPFEDAGFVCRSVSSDLKGVLLTYKIERPVFGAFKVDTEFGLNAISSLPLPLDEFIIEVDEAKLTYLKTAKAGSMQRAGFEAISSSGLSAIIRAKIDASYIYNVAFLQEHNVAKFNIIVELPSKSAAEPTRLLAALKYMSEEKKLTLLTLF